VPSALIDGIHQAFDRLRSSPRHEPRWLKLDAGGDGARKLDSRSEYFEVRVDRLQLTSEREWLTRYAPVVLAAAEFSYDGQTVITPTVIGPALIDRLGQRAPTNAVLANTRVIGPCPVRGSLAVTVVLFTIPREQLLEPLINLVEEAAGALDLLSGIVPYTQIAGVVMSGVEALSGANKPLLARRDEFSPVETGHFALIDAPEGADLSGLTVSDGRIVRDGAPFEGHDYVLYSIRSVPPSELDLERLPLHRLWRAVLEDANNSATADRWTSTKTKMSTLVSQLYASPDITWTHAEQLHDEWVQTMQVLHEKAERLAHLAPEPPQRAKARQRSLAILEL
jgi:hypothetical protein